MARPWQYIVRPQQDGWQVVLGRRVFGPYGSRQCAVRVAINAAEAAARKGHDAAVILEQQDRRFIEWTAGTAPP
jgi:hypothetical protein